MSTSAPSTSRWAARRSFSLTELVVATAITTILLASIASVITLSTKVLPRDDQAADPAQVAAAGFAVLSEDLRQATRITAVSATSITFKVADRDANGVEESITYAWAATAGAPLTRTINGGTAQIILDNVRCLAFTADTFSAERISTSGTAESAEALLEEYNPSSTGSGGGVNISSSSNPGMYLRPVLPADAVSWRPTRLLIKADKESGGRNTTLLVRRVDSSRRPLLSNLWTAGATNTSADNQTWRTISLSSLSAVNADEGLAFAFSGALLNNSSRVYPDTGVLAPYSGYLLSSNGGLSWTFTKSSAFPYRLYGCVTRPVTVSTPYTRADRVEVLLKVNSDSAAEIRTSVALAARPEVG